MKQSILSKREANYDLFDLKIRAKSVCWFLVGQVGKELLETLALFDSNVLRRVCITESISLKVFEKLVRTEHWRNLERVMFVSRMDVSIDYFLHLGRYDIKLKELKATDVWRAVQKMLFNDSPRLSGFTIFYSNTLTVEEIFKHTIIPMTDEPLKETWLTAQHTQRFRMTIGVHIFVLLFLDGWIQGFVGRVIDINQEYSRFMNNFF
ncbi:hypothetical protein GCK72_019752 [Caenorhabditis remanei]|uniref:DUF38 domain-containing protein n=1 Tax=Caenorhabditis remanei TaxID=31234 RepID=A0A6A5GES2_CAERE|nr:hypothetical protein GCK72_019752 [Caenorhabditis remanei]KAF1753196.1 hypothetical protein GCK72_019752 [Caenorhabditis remanei]